MIEITIKGAAGSGKTTVALILQQALRAHGAQVLVEEENPKESLDVLLSRRSALNAFSMAGRPVIIKTAQLPRGEPCEVFITVIPSSAAPSNPQENSQ